MTILNAIIEAEKASKEKREKALLDAKETLEATHVFCEKETKAILEQARLEAQKIEKQTDEELAKKQAINDKVLTEMSEKLVKNTSKDTQELVNFVVKKVLEL